MGFPGGAFGKELAANSGEKEMGGSIHESGRSTHSSIQNPMDRGAWQAAVHSIAESDMIEMTLACMYLL